MSNGGVNKPGGGAVANDDVDGNNGSGNDADCEDDNNGVGTPGHCGTVATHAQSGGHEHTTVTESSTTTVATHVLAGVGKVVSDVSVAPENEQGTNGTLSGSAAAQGSATTTSVLGERFTRSIATASGTTAGATGLAETSPSSAVGSIASAASPTASSLPFTGSQDMPLVAIIGAAGVITGAGLVRIARRRDHGDADITAAGDAALS